MKQSINEEKRNKITAAITINAVLLVFILVAVVIAQIVSIGVLTKRRNKLVSEEEQLQQQLEESEDVLDRLENDDKYLQTVIQITQIGNSQKSGS